MASEHSFQLGQIAANDKSLGVRQAEVTRPPATEAKDSAPTINNSSKGIGGPGALRPCPLCGVRRTQQELEAHLLAHTNGFIPRSRPTQQPKLKPHRPRKTKILCPHCGTRVKESGFTKHVHEMHSVQPPEPKAKTGQIRAISAVPRANPFPLVPCPLCGEKVRADCMDRHNKNFHTPEQPRSALDSSAIPLPFEFLPPGTWMMEDIIERFAKLSKGSLRAVASGQYDPSRLRAIDTMKPSGCYQGILGMRGYVVFTFKFSERVVLECPYEGNAIYILSGDWMSIVGHTKFEIRHEYADQCTVVIHKGGWLRRVRQALMGS